MFESRAFLSLKGFAPQLLILFLSKRQFVRVGQKGKEQRICANCDSLTFTYIQAEKEYGIDRHKFKRALDELLAKGFIEVKHAGGAYLQDKSIYALSPRWVTWVPNAVCFKREQEVIQRGYRKPKRAQVDQEIRRKMNEPTARVRRAKPSEKKGAGRAT